MMTDRIWRWLACAVGVVLILIGSIPLTPLIWLLVLMKVSWWPLPFRLAFWQTQSIGLVLVVCGFALVMLAVRSKR